MRKLFLRLILSVAFLLTATVMEANTSNDLIEAAGKGELKNVQELIASGVDVNVETEDGGTALFAAAAGGHQEIVVALLDADANPNLKLGKDEITALMIASAMGHHEVVQALLDGGADLNLTTSDGGTAGPNKSFEGTTLAPHSVMPGVDEIFDDGHTMDIGAWVKPHFPIQGIIFESSPHSKSRLDWSLRCIPVGNVYCQQECC